MKLTTKEWLKLLPLDVREKIIMFDYDIIKNKLDLYYSLMSDMINDLCSWAETHDSDFYNKLYDIYTEKEKKYKNNKHLLDYLPQLEEKDVALFYRSLDIKV